MNKKINTNTIDEAYERLKEVVSKTPLQLNKRLSEKFKANIYLKREDLQIIRSYKLRGAYNRISLLAKKEKTGGIVCASAGNHAQGVAWSCEKLKIHGYIFMPKNTPKQKIERVRSLGKKWISLILSGDNFDDAYHEAINFANNKHKTFIHPFNDPLVISGQGTVAVEIFEELGKSPDYLVVPVGGGGLISGVGIYGKSKNPKIKIIGAEPQGAASMSASIKAGKIITLDKINKFVDGAAVKTVGDLTFQIAKKYTDKMIVVLEGKICQDMILLYQNDGIITEPAGALAISALESLQSEIKGKTVVCIVSGGNNDISRYPEIIEQDLIYQGLKHYFIIEFSQTPGTLRRYLDEALGPNDDITLFEYTKKNNKEFGPALVGIELSKKSDFKPLLKRMNKIGLDYQILKKDSALFKFVV